VGKIWPCVVAVWLRNLAWAVEGWCQKLALCGGGVVEKTGLAVVELWWKKLAPNFGCI
jgi:hypothetical protein